MSKTLAGAEVKVYIGGELYPECQSISYVTDYAEDPVYGVDSVFAQEIATSRISVNGSVVGLKLKTGGGLQGNGIVSRVTETLYAPYTTLKIVDRATNLTIFECDQVKIASESVSIQAKGSVRISFNWKGIIPKGELDIYSP
jgi:hypothetical protein